MALVYVECTFDMDVLTCGQKELMRKMRRMRRKKKKRRAKRRRTLSLRRSL